MHLITGASGFIGMALVRAYHDASEPVRAAVRRPTSAGQIGIPSIDGNTDWSAALAGVDTVVHLAGRVHVMAPDPGADLMRRVNVEGTVRLAEDAVRAGVRRFVFVSTVKVNGEFTGVAGLPACFSAADTPDPVGAYAESKFEAEQRLRDICDRNAMELCIVRPPLVYGPGAGANFARLVRLVRKGVPLPFASVDNRRSMIFLDNLISLLRVCTTSPKARDRVFMASDGCDLSTPELIRRLAVAMGRKARLVGVPVGILEFGAGLIGRKAEMQRLCRSLRVDISETCRCLGWEPPVAVDAAIRESVAEGR